MTSTLERPSWRLALAATVLWAVAFGAAAAPARIEVTEGPPPPPPRGSALLGLGRLELGGEHIGGLSSIIRLPESGRLLLATDRGWLLDVAPRLGASGALAGLDDARMTRLPIPSGWSSDVEAMAIDADQLVIATEGNARRPHRLIRFAGPVTRPRAVLSDRRVDDLGLEANRGFEALVDLPEGGWLGIAETAIDGTFPVLARDGRRWRYRAAPEHAPTGADRLGDRIFVVERKVSLLGGWQARVACLEVDQLATEAVLEPWTLARLGIADDIDNLEGIAVWRRGNDLEILLVSDDNFHAAQRSLILHYRWPGGASGGCRPRPHEQPEG